MTQEEKLQEAKRLYKTANSDQRYVLESLFPELAESEDEKIRKALLKFHASTIDIDGIQGKEILAWLEKQGEQKPSDKVEPKFKVGDWVIDKQGIVHQIANVVEIVTCNTYGYDIVGGGYFNDNIEGVRLWTIQDAKDGDVLARNNDVLSICIFSRFDGINDKYESFLCRCGIEGEGLGSSISINGYHDDSKDYVPATKEQREILFQKMKEAGYEWSSEHRKLIKRE